VGHRINIFIFSIIIFFVAGNIFSGTIEGIDNRAENYYKKRELSKAITEWLKILSLDPDNEKVQKKIEFVYDEKHRKDISLQKATMYLQLAKKEIKRDIKKCKINTEKSIKNFIIAYRIDPKDPTLQKLKKKMKKFDEVIRLEEAKMKLSKQLRSEYYQLLSRARLMMQRGNYIEALKVWDDILVLVPIDKIAHDGKRRAELAIRNRLKYERIMELVRSGIALFNKTKYKQAKFEFKQVLKIDLENVEAEEYIDKIDEILEKKKIYDLKVIQAEQFYISGLENLKGKNFDVSEEDFENVLSLFEDYKDVKQRLKSIAILRKEYEEHQRSIKLKKINKEFQSGIVALIDGKYKDAISAFGITLRLDPNNNLAKRYLKTAQDALKQIMEEIVDENSAYFDIINSLIVPGKYLYERGDYIESRMRWEKILKLFPKNRIATEYLLKCNLKLNPKAFEEFATKIIDEGKILLKHKKYRLALSKFMLIKLILATYPGIDRLIAIASKRSDRKGRTSTVSYADIEKRYKIGMDYYRMGGEDNLAKALEQFRWIVAINPNNVKALINMNKIESQLRVDVEDFQRDEIKLTNKQRRLIRVHYFQGINYYSNNNFQKAIKEWKKVLAIDSKHEKAKNNIRKCLVLIK